jgi:hypothetical protein
MMQYGLRGEGHAGSSPEYVCRNFDCLEFGISKPADGFRRVSRRTGRRRASLPSSSEGSWWG